MELDWNRDSAQVILIISAVLLLIAALVRTVDTWQSGGDRPLVSVKAPKAGLFLLRDEWLDEPAFPIDEANAAAAGLVLFDQFASRPCFNEANRRLLTAVPGIGDKLAQLILEYRDSVGEVSSSEALLAIPGVGAKKVEALEKAFLFGPCVPPAEPKVIGL